MKQSLWFEKDLLEVKVAQWDSVLHLEWEGSQFKSSWKAQSGIGTQHHYKAPGNLWVKSEVVQWYILIEWNNWDSQIAD